MVWLNGYMSKSFLSVPTSQWSNTCYQNCVGAGSFPGAESVDLEVWWLSEYRSGSLLQSWQRSEKETVRRNAVVLFNQHSKQHKKHAHTECMWRVVCITVCVCVCICVYMCICVCVCVCVCVLDGKGSKVFASRAPLQMTMHLTSYSDCQTGFHEPFSPLYKCYTSLKNV